MMTALFLALLLTLGAPPAQESTPRQDPATPVSAKVLAWTARNGIAYEYHLPEGYDPARGANLVVVLHGNGLDQRWTFWNHPPGKFRPHDIVVSPDGTTAHQGTGANEFLDGERDVQRFKELLLEWKSQWTVRQTFLYGHSQGSFFAFHYAGVEPRTIDGVVGHASGVWMHTRQAKDGHRLAIGLMHGTDDHIPYGQGWYGRKSFRDAGYPLVHLRTLFDWPHAPHWVQAGLVLSWCEGMTSEDPARIERALEEFSDLDVLGGPNLAALGAVAGRLAKLGSANEGQRRRAAARAKAVDELARGLLTRIERGWGKQRLPRVAGEEWLGLSIRVAEEFDGLPVLASFLAGKGRVLDDVRRAADEVLADYGRQRERDPAAALAAALELLEKGWISWHAPALALEARGWLARADELKLDKRLRTLDLGR